MEKDIKYLGVPNICFSLTTSTDSREEKFKKQRIERGFDDSETWSLRDTIANFIIPRLECYEEIANDALIRDQELKDNIQKFLTSMKLIAADGKGEILTKKHWEEVYEGLETFPKVFLSLWW
jgi:hypothetical protein